MANSGVTVNMMDRVFELLTIEPPGDFAKARIDELVKFIRTTLADLDF